MGIRRILTLARRVVAQLRADHRTIALIVVVPMILLSMAAVLLHLQPSSALVGVVQEDAGATLVALAASNLPTQPAYRPAPSPTLPLPSPSPHTSTPAPTPVPTATPTPEAGVTPGPVTHTVQAGDTLGEIARLYNVSLAALQAANGIENPNLVSAGQELVIPVAGTAAEPEMPPTATSAPATATAPPTDTPAPSATATATGTATATPAIAARTAGMATSIPAGRSVNLGQTLTEALQSLNAFTVVTMTAAEGQEKLASGEAVAVISLPPDFSAEAVQNRRIALSVQYEGSNPSIANRLGDLLERASVQAFTNLTLQALPVAAPEPPRVELEESYEHGGPQFESLDYLAPALIGILVFFFVFILTSVAFLRERLSGTLERLQATPITPLEVVLGYMLGFLLFALLQGAITLLFTVYVVDVHYSGSLLVVFVVEALLAITAVNLGIFLSTFARNEFQVLQFIPLVVTTQVLLGGIIWEVQDMPNWLRPLAWLMPLTYANKALRAVMIRDEGLGTIYPYLLALLAMGAVLVLLSARTAGRTAR